MKRLIWVMLLVSISIIPALYAEEMAEFESENGWIKLQYPEEWAIEEREGTVQLANTEEVLVRADSDDPAEAGDIFITIAMLPTEYLSLLGIEGEGLDEWAEGLWLSFRPESELEGEAEVVEFDEDIEFGQVIFSARRGDGAIIVFRPAEGVVGVAIIGVALEDVESTLEVIHSILATVEFTATPEELLLSLSN